MDGPLTHSPNDGHAGAVAGAAQHPDLLKGYKRRPSWKIAGVNYRVGLADGFALTDWRGLSGQGVSVNPATGIVRVDNTAGATIESVDFSTAGGAVLMLVNSPAPTVRRCRFTRGGLVPGFANMIAADSRSPGLTVSYSEIDGGAPNYTNGSTLVSVLGGGKSVVEYCWLKNSPQHALETTGPDLDISYRFNMIENIGNNGAPGNHPNLLQWEYPTGTTRALVAFNTTFQPKGIRAGEGFQFYPISGSVDNIDCSNNTMLAPGTAGGQAASYMLHGTAGKNAKYRDNFFDASGTYGAFYPGSFAGAVVSGNIDMNTGLVITP